MYSIKPIGVIQSVFQDMGSTARQSRIDGRPGRLVLDRKYMEGLCGLEGFSHIIVLYYFHKQAEVRLRARPLFDQENSYGIFASRFPSRPNHIGMSVLTIERIEENIIYCRDVDTLTETPILDIKPYVRHFDCVARSHCGWYEKVNWECIVASGTSREEAEAGV
ncbi:MAG: tRNA (N6-threonylcarbamoyladenosine(37)-N6)-methyltransferase TrmO [Gammaproteobacteria bacterium]